MSSIHLDLDFTDVDEPVAAALASLMIAIGGKATVSTTIRKPAAPVEEPLAQVAGGEPAARLEPKHEAPIVALEPSVPKVPVAPPEPIVPTMTWPEFTQGLSPTSQAFLSLVERSGRLSMSAAVGELGLAGGKALGGLTGALRRRAARAGFGLPFEAIREGGERVWISTGMMALTPSEPMEAPAKPAKAPVEKVTWREFRAGLSDDTNKFIDLIIAKKTVTLIEAMDGLDKSSGRAIGGLSGALKRKANGRGIVLPFVPTRDGDGGRIWVFQPAALKKLEG